MKEIWVKDFRCFRDEQHARLAPLTLLVGENSTGKTSFLAMVRALWDLAHHRQVPDFNEDPYNLGSFDEIAHHRGARGSQSNFFTAGFSRPSHRAYYDGTSDSDTRFQVVFGERGAAPYPIRRQLTRGSVWIDEHFKDGLTQKVEVGTSNGSWERDIPEEQEYWQVSIGNGLPEPMAGMSFRRIGSGEMELVGFRALNASPVFTVTDQNQVTELAHLTFSYGPFRPFAGAPIRSKPLRTYERRRATSDAEGTNVPNFLFEALLGKDEYGLALKQVLEGFGKASGLFDEISIRALGKRGSEPFQIQIRKYSGGLKGPHRNLIDVGYGVSQALPVITEILRPDAPSMFLLQQPEVHLHPRAQAALGSLFCQVAGPERQLLVETHSDHLIDRVRMDVRDGKSNLTPDDVSILYFERGELDVKIHSLGIDEQGNITNVPPGYRRFFMEEVERSLWKM